MSAKAATPRLPQQQGASAPARYETTAQHDISRCERGLSPILGATCPCGGTLFGKMRGDGYEFFASLPADDAHSFASLPRKDIQPGNTEPGRSSTS